MTDQVLLGGIIVWAVAWFVGYISGRRDERKRQNKFWRPQLLQAESEARVARDGINATTHSYENALKEVLEDPELAESVRRGAGLPLVTRRFPSADEIERMHRPKIAKAAQWNLPTHHEETDADWVTRARRTP